MASFMKASAEEVFEPARNLQLAPPEQLVNAIQVMARGDVLLDPAVTRAVISAAVHNEGR